MKPELKFRAWVKTPKECFMAIQGTPDLETLQSFMFHYGDQDLEEFTGIKDKNGIEIFQNDIIKDPKNSFYRIYKVRGGFAIKAGYWSLNKHDLVETDYLILQPLAEAQMASYISESCEVIGNIHQHTDLLTK